MRAQLQYRLPQTPELLTICLTIVCVSFSPSSPFPVSRCLYLSWTLRCRRVSGGGVLAFDVPITCREHGDRRLPAAGRAKPRQPGAPPHGTGKKKMGASHLAMNHPPRVSGLRGAAVQSHQVCPSRRSRAPRGSHGPSGVRLRAEKPFLGRSGGKAAEHGEVCARA